MPFLLHHRYPYHGSPRVTASPIRVTLTRLLPFLFFRFLVVSGFAAFNVTFIFVMPTLAAIPARDCAAEVVLVFYVPNIFSLLLTLQLEEASASPITVMDVARYTFVVRRTTVRKIGNPFAIGAGGLLQVPQLPTTTLTGVKVWLGRPPSKIHLSKGLPSQMLAHILVHVGVLLPLHGQLHQEIYKIIVKVRASFALGRLGAVPSGLGRNFSFEPEVRLSRPVGGGIYPPHELRKLRHKRGDTGSCWEFGE